MIFFFSIFGQVALSMKEQLNNNQTKSINRQKKTWYLQKYINMTPKVTNCSLIMVKYFNYISSFLYGISWSDLYLLTSNIFFSFFINI